MNNQLPQNQPTDNNRDITYHRNPTPGEIKFGEGAIHYKDFDVCFCWSDEFDRPKKWLICPVDGLRYYR